MKYSVEDMDRMRKAIIKRGERPHPNPYGAEDKRAWHQEIEERLRTYMLSETTPEELEAAPIIGPEYANTWQQNYSGSGR